MPRSRRSATTSCPARSRKGRTRARLGRAHRLTHPSDTLPSGRSPTWRPSGRVVASGDQPASKVGSVASSEAKVKGANNPIGSLTWKFATGLRHDAVCSSLSSISACLDCSFSLCRVDGLSPSGTSRSWCSDTRCVCSNGSFTGGSGIGQRIGRSSPYSAGCSPEASGDLSWSPQRPCCGGIGKRPSASGDVGEGNEALVARR